MVISFLVSKQLGTFFKAPTNVEITTNDRSTSTRKVVHSNWPHAQCYRMLFVLGSQLL